jgi:hypothetical protein
MADLGVLRRYRTRPLILGNKQSGLAVSGSFQKETCGALHAPGIPFTTTSGARAKRNLKREFP